MMIRIDIHPAGENLIHTPRTLPAPVHICHPYASCERSLYVATFHTKWPVGPALISLPNMTIQAVHLSQTFIDEHATSVY
jgi:hypothetical protein